MEREGFRGHDADGKWCSIAVLSCSAKKIIPLKLKLFLLPTGGKGSLIKVGPHQFVIFVEITVAAIMLYFVFT